MLNFVLCDDYKPIRDVLTKYVEASFIKYDIAADIGLSSGNPEEVLKYLKTNHTDVLIVDVELNSNINGIDIAKEFRRINNSAYIIFLSGHMDYVFQSLKVKIFDYLLKPLAGDKLNNCILRLINDIRSPKSNYISFGKNKMTNKDSIFYIEKDGMKTIIHMKNSSFVVYSSLNHLEICLGDSFVRCHKSYIINTAYIENIDIVGNSLALFNGITCPIGAKYRKKLLEVIENVHSKSIVN